MATFYDDFERANGPLGGNWVVDAGTLNISGGFVVPSAASGIAHNTTITDSGRHDCRITAGYVATDSGTAQACVKWGAVSSRCYGAYITYSAPNFTFNIGKGNYGRQTVIASEVIGASLPFQWTVTLVYDQGTLTATYGGITLTVQDIEYAGGQYMGIYGLNGNVRIADVTMIAGSAPQLTVSPDVIPNYGIVSSVTFNGSNTSWTPGIPGSPTFTCDHGTLTEQVVVSATLATAVYNPGSYLGPVTFRDPSTGATYTCVVSSNPIVIPPVTGPGSISQLALDWLQAQAEHGGLVVAEQQSGAEDQTEGIYLKGAFGEILLGKRVSVGRPAGEPDIPIEYLLWQILNGSLTPSPTSNIFLNTSLLRSDTDTLLTRTDLAKSGGSYAVGSLLREIAGFPGGSIQDVLTALQGVSAPDLEPILTAISALGNDLSPTVGNIALALEALRTGSNYDLADVKAWIDALPQVQGAVSAAAVVALVAALALAAPSGGASVAAAAVAVGAGPILDLATIVEIVGVATEIAGLVADVQELKNQPAAGLGAIVLDETQYHRVLGSPISFSEPFVHSGACDGVLYTIGTSASGVKAWNVGDYTVMSGAGAVGFFDSLGNPEPYQWLGFNRGAVLPAQLVHPAGFVFSSNRALSGTVTPFTIARNT